MEMESQLHMLTDLEQQQKKMEQQQKQMKVTNNILDLLKQMICINTQLHNIMSF